MTNCNRILLIGTVPPPSGGDATWAKAFLNYCSRLSICTYLVNTSLIGNRALSVNHSRNIPDEIKRSIRIWKELKKGIDRFFPDIVHMNVNCSPLGSVRDLITAKIVRKRKVPLVIHCHCNIKDQIGKKPINIRILRKLLLLSNKVIVLNQESNSFVKSMGISNSIIVPNFIDSMFICERKVISPNINRVIFLGHVKKHKGVDEILAAARLLPNIQFILAGPVTSDYKHDEIINASIGNVVLLGMITSKEVKEQLTVSDLFLLPTYTEGFSVAILEAMACGVPVITTDVGANYEMIEEHGGIIIPKQDTLGIVHAIEKLSDYEIRKRMSSWNIQKIKSMYTIESIFSSLMSVYVEVIHETTH